jgi:hypothetical protein
LSRRAIVTMHRQVFDEFAAWLKEERLDPLHVKVFDPFDYFIDEDVTWRNDVARRLLADPSARNLFFTDDFGVLQATNLAIDLAPELKQLTGSQKRRAGTNPTS